MPTDPNLIVGSETCDDAGVYRLSEDTALIQTVDFFTPIVDDPFDFGRITAANALSDVYAMGGRPLLCMNILACPVGILADQVFRDVIKGGLAKIKEAGALLVGGHSIEDSELKYGLSVTGIVHPDQVLLNSGALIGDVLMLTKPLGTGILSTAIKGELGGSELEKKLVEVMTTLNRLPVEIIRENHLVVHACTDITGFGLLGHIHEMAAASRISVHIDCSALPILPETIEFAEMGIIPAGAYRNQEYYRQWVKSSRSEGDSLEMICYDPQTSGGLLLAMPAVDAERLITALKEKKYPLSSDLIGKIVQGSPGSIFLQ